MQVPLELKKKSLTLEEENLKVKKIVKLQPNKLNFVACFYA